MRIKIDPDLIVWVYYQSRRGPKFHAFTLGEKVSLCKCVEKRFEVDSLPKKAPLCLHCKILTGTPLTFLH